MLHDKLDIMDVDARTMMMSLVDDDILYQFEWQYTTKGLWDDLRAKFGVCRTAQLCSLNINFYSSKINPQHSMRQHMMYMNLGLKEMG